MKNIIQHLWQAQTNYIRIMPTIVKTEGNTPKSYFYSQKQHRVLRKKEQSVQSAMDNLRVKEQPSQKFMVIKLMGNSCVDFDFVIESQVNQLLNDPITNCLVVGVQNSQQTTGLFKIKLDYRFQEISCQTVVNFNRNTGIWTDGGELNVKMENGLEKIIVQFWKRFADCLARDMKIGFQCKKVELIVSCDCGWKDIAIIWCSQLIFQKQSFYELNYRTVQAKPTKSTQKQNITINQRQPLPTVSSPQCKLQLPQQQQCSSIQCKGCGQKTGQSTTKQLSNQQVVFLRRCHNLSIMGLFDEYYQVCPSCYLSSQ